MKFEDKEKKRFNIALSAGIQRSILYTEIIKEIKETNNKPSKELMEQIEINLKKISNDDILKYAKNKTELKKLVKKVIN